MSQVPISHRLLPLILSTLFLPAISYGQSSIESTDLPKAPSSRYDVEQVEHINPEEERWYQAYSFYTEGGNEVKHGVYIERIRSKDRERHATHYEETRRMYYSGEPSAHYVFSVWIDGVLRRRDYHISDSLTITLEYNEEGEVMRGLNQKARGGRAKRERITNLFDDVYNLNNS